MPNAELIELITLLRSKAYRKLSRIHDEMLERLEDEARVRCLKLP